jgi:ATP-dependent protease ClpP protease subunit
MALSQGNSWYRIRNATSNEPAQLHIYDEIGMLGVSASDLIDKLSAVSGPIDVHLNSPGGEVFEGLAIYNALLQRDDVNVFIDGMAASIASVIAMAGKKISIARSARMMVHDGFCLAIGNANDMRQLADQLDFESDNIAGIYAYHTGQSQAYWRDIMRQEKWYNAEMAIEAGLAHEIIETRGGANSVSAQDRINAKDWDLSIYKNARELELAGVQNKADVQDAATHSYTGDHDTAHEPITGMHTHNHASFGCVDGDDGIHSHAHTHNGDAVHDHSPHTMHEHSHAHGGGHTHAHEAGMGNYGPHAHAHAHGNSDPDHDGDNDASAAGDTDHDYWAAPARNNAEDEERTVIKMHVDLHNASYDDSPWDGGAAMSAASSSANPASALSAICAGRKSGDASKQEAHALPHHKRPGSPPNKAGVTAALGRLNQTQDLTNKSAAEAHLKAHAAAWSSGSDDMADGHGITNHTHTHDNGNILDFTDEELAQLAQTLKGVQ